MLIMINGDNKMTRTWQCENYKDNLDLHGVIGDSKDFNALYIN